MTTTIDKWHIRFLRLALEVSSWSKDPSTKVGCVLADERKRVIGMGFNGLPAGIADTVERLLDREAKLALTIHAEENALLFATQSVRGSIAYITRHPCSNCAAKLIQSGVSVVIYLANPGFERRWADNLRFSKQALMEAGIPVLSVSPTYLDFEE